MSVECHLTVFPHSCKYLNYSSLVSQNNLNNLIIQLYFFLMMSFYNPLTRLVIWESTLMIILLFLIIFLLCVIHAFFTFDIWDVYAKPLPPKFEPVKCRLRSRRANHLTTQDWKSKHGIKSWLEIRYFKLMNEWKKNGGICWTEAPLILVMLKLTSSITGLKLRHSVNGKAKFVLPFSSISIDTHFKQWLIQGGDRNDCPPPVPTLPRRGKTFVWGFSFDVGRLCEDSNLPLRAYACARLHGGHCPPGLHSLKT